MPFQQCLSACVNLGEHSIYAQIFTTAPDGPRVHDVVQFALKVPVYHHGNYSNGAKHHRLAKIQ